MRPETLRKRLKGLFGSIKTSLSPNRSSRRGVRPRLCVIHTTESGPGTLWGVVNYFGNAGIEVSSTYVVGDEARPDGWVDVVLCVPEDEKPWTQKSANPYSISYELIGRAARSRDEWMRHEAQLRTVAAMVAEDCLQYDIPPKRGYPGILGHRDLQHFGFPNDHTDPGPDFPWQHFIGLVKSFMREGKPAPEKKVVNAKGRPRPAGIPRRIPKWAWVFREWHLGGRRGRKPKGIPTPLPKWFWPWMQWSTGTGLHGKRLPSGQD